MMASLRARLLVAVLALTACGLLLAGGVTYIEQRSFQYSRVDQELKAAVMPVSGALERMVGHEPYGHDGPEPGRGPGGVYTPGSVNATAGGLPSSRRRSSSRLAFGQACSTLAGFNLDSSSNDTLPFA